MGRSRAEQETILRWDNEARTLEAGTTDPRVAERWKRAVYPVRPLRHVEAGEPCSWELSIPWTGRKGDWTRVFSRSVPKFATAGDEEAPEVSGEGVSEESGEPDRAN